MTMIAFLVYTACVFQAGRAEAGGRNSGWFWGGAFVAAIVMLSART